MTTETEEIGFDLETTGIDVKRDAPLQIALVAREGDRIRPVINTLCNPCRPINEEAAKVHGITQEMVAGMPDYVVSLWVVATVVDGLKPKRLITANGKSFDVPMTINCLGFNPFEGIPHFDILQMAFRYFPELTSRKVTALYHHFIGGDMENAHDATADVIASMQIFKAMAGRIGMRLDELHQELSVPKPYSVIPFGKYAGCVIDEVPVSWAAYMNKKGDLSPDLQATVDHILNR